MPATEPAPAPTEETQPEARPAAAFAGLAAAIAALRERDPAEIRAGHRDLGEGLWLSCDPDGEATMACRPAEAGFELRVTGADTSAWTCLGLRLDPATLAGGRYLGLLIEADSAGVVCFTPALRFFLPEGPRDHGPAEPVVLAGGPRSHLAHIPIDPDQARRATGSELNLFFHDDSMALEVRRLDVLLMR